MVSKEYDYIRGNTVLNPKRRYDEERRKQERESIDRQRKEQQRKQREAKKAVVKNILQVASIALVLGVLTIARDGKMYRLQNDLSNVKTEVKTIKAENEALRVNLLKFSSLGDIKAFASKEGMKVSQKDDIIYVNTTKDFFANIKE